MRIAFLIGPLGQGGAERQLSLVARGLKQIGHEVTVYVFYPGGAFENELREAGVNVHALTSGRVRTFHNTAALFLKLVKALRTEAPDVLYSFLVESNIMGILLRSMIPGIESVGACEPRSEICLICP